ncbi:serine/threonine protein kinase [Nocardiopsis valliformis]|uniref:serine/threonine protein kinase n=1 Tax=Nocardiopsis valliformis TaxID=239974 RepID=UPI00034759BE|nr:serine/threonine-protein kinase [Nocardiopsis valliformis]
MGEQAESVDLSEIIRGPLPLGVTPPRPGDPVTIGPYRILGRIGAGGMGVVYAGVDSGGSCVAVKVIHPEYSDDTDFRGRFAREVRTMRRVGGLCAVQVLADDTEAARPWLATPYIAGPTLRDHTRLRGPLSGGMLLGFAAGVAEALVALHQAGVVHRDLKPANVILSPSGPRMLDFGIARLGDETGITGTGQIIGSPGWISPEQYRGHPTGPAADVFAWGALVAYAATGRQPFGTGATEVLAFRVLQDEPDLDGLPEELNPLVSAAMAKEPGERPEANRLLRSVNALWSGQEDSGMTLVQDTRVLTRMLDSEWTALAPAPARSEPAQYTRLPTGPRPERYTAQRHSAQQHPAPAPPARPSLSPRRGPALLAALAALSLVAVVALGGLLGLLSQRGADTPNDSGNPGADSPDAEDAENTAVGGAPTENAEPDTPPQAAPYDLDEMVRQVEAHGFEAYPDAVEHRLNEGSLQALSAGCAADFIGSHCYQVFFFHDNEMVAVGAAPGGQQFNEGVWYHGAPTFDYLNGEVVKVHHYLLTADDPMCCPSGGPVIQTYSFSGGRVVYDETGHPGGDTSGANAPGTEVLPRFDF